jgi:tetratricopeptide (TPR) repeat protein
MVSLALLALLLLGQSPRAWSQSLAQAETVTLAQSIPPIEPLTTTGALDENSQLLENGHYINGHIFEGVAGQMVIIDLISDEFDASFALLAPDGEIIARDNGGGEGTNARFALSLPETGTYQVGASSSTPRVMGRYQLTVQPGTAADVERSERLVEATRLNAQGAELYRAGRYGEAEPLYLDALAMRKRLLGEAHPDVALSLNNLGALYVSQGRYGEAELLVQESLTIYRGQWGERHPSVATSLNNLATLYQFQGRYGEAEALYQE